MTTLLIVLLAVSLTAIFLPLIDAAINSYNDRHSEQLAETDRDWRRSIPSRWRTDATRLLDEPGFFEVPQGAERVGLDEERAA